MKIIRLEEVLEKEEVKSLVIEKIKEGSVFIYPTDTVYGIGCNALKRRSVLRIRRIKNTQHPFSVIAPSKEWITENLQVDNREVLRKLPGPFTYIFYFKKRVLPEEVSHSDKLGVRIPLHPFTKIIRLADVPFITTSANVSGEKTIESLDDMPERLRMSDFFIDGGRITGKPSTVIDYTCKPPRVLRK